MKVAIFDDVVYARGEVFRIPGLEVEVFSHADNAASACVNGNFEVVFMDYAMGVGRKSGAAAIKSARDAGFVGRIVAISSDPVANAEMCDAGANESLAKKAHLRSFLVFLSRSGTATEAATTDSTAATMNSDSDGTPPRSGG